MGIGYIKVEAHTADDALPVGNAHVEIRKPNGRLLYETDTDANGNTEKFPLMAPDIELTLDPYYGKPAYSICDVDVTAAGYVRIHVHGVQIVDTQTAILPVNMLPLSEEAEPETDRDFFLPPLGLLLPPDGRNPVGPLADELAQNQSEQNRIPGTRNTRETIQRLENVNLDPIIAQATSDIVIPDYITVHLGIPTNSSARNLRVKFSDYIKNVVSSEIYTTWPESSLLANINVIVTFALNRIYTEWYRSRGFVFDITNSTSYDQYFREGAEIYENISRLVDQYFNTFVRRFGFRNPFFTQFCNGTTATCPGLSQWGTVTLANQGMTPIQILRYYYPNDIELAASQNITAITASYPGAPLHVGSQGSDVRRMQNFLNRIRVNFPLIPVISNPNGAFNADTQDAVRTFQRTFNLTADGVIGNATWNKITFIYMGVARLAELESEGERIGLGETPPATVLSQGSRGHDVLELQFILNFIAPYYDSIPTVIQDSVFGTNLKNAVIEFQKSFHLTADGVVGPTTWNKLYAVYKGINKNVPVPPAEGQEPPAIPQYPGYLLRVGTTGPNVRLMQTYLNTIRIVYTSIPYVTVDSVFGEQMRRSVVAFQQQFLLTPDGIIGPITWDYIVKQYRLLTGGVSISLEYPGVPLGIGSTGTNVRLMQGFLLELHSAHASIPAIAADGIFGANTRVAVTEFQRLFGLTPDGIIGPLTWDAIVKARNEIA